MLYSGYRQLFLYFFSLIIKHFSVDPPDRSLDRIVDKNHSYVGADTRVPLRKYLCGDREKEKPDRIITGLSKLPARLSGRCCPRYRALRRTANVQKNGKRCSKN